MSVVSCNEIWDGRKATKEFNRRQYTRVFRVITNSALDGPLVVCAAGGLPAMSFPYITSTEADNGALVVKHDPQQQDDPLIWLVNVEYDSEQELEDQFEEDPLARPPVYAVTTQRYEKVLECDLDGNPIMNSASIPYDPPISIEEVRMLLTIDINVATVNWERDGELNGAVNSDPWNGFLENELRCFVESQEERENDTAFWVRHYTLEYRPILDEDIEYGDPVDGPKRGGWNPLFVLDKSTMMRDDVTQELVSIKDDRGQAVETPVLLDGEGFPIDLSADPPIPPHYQPFEVYRTTSFDDVP